jgi:hypothetical protein
VKKKQTSKHTLSKIETLSISIKTKEIIYNPSEPRKKSRNLKAETEKIKVNKL